MRVGFLHPYKMADHFFVEAIESAAIADLCADGHDAEAVDFIFDPERPEKDQLAELREALEREQYDVLFVQRLWSEDAGRALQGLPIVGWSAPDLVERGLVGASVVEPTREVARAVVHALATSGSLEHVAGVTTRERAAVRTKKVSALSELADASFAYDRRRTLSRIAANEHRAIVLSNLGCAYRNVPNRTGVFDGVELPTAVSTAGCTFCDADSYERMTEGDAVALLVRQIRAVLEQRPSVQQIAIKDDYAVRFIGRLGDALRPLGLGAREVMLSARADYLLELRGEIEEALAGRFPAALGFYLIGFENFAEAELERFNKGMSAAQMEHAVQLMHQWAERYPGRFRVTPTGGFILFTPWTTLPDLRVNADVMRRLGFERFRGRALLSQLRLYPNLPLYWLAKRDGLLLDRFARPEDSDAARRGYEADHPWRFRDAKVAEVQRALLDAAPSSNDARLFEVFEQALDEAAGVARGKKGRPARMAPAPSDVSRRGPATSSIALNRRCNQDCSFCTQHGSEKLDDRSRAARAIHAVRRAAADGVRSIVLTGGEPSLEWYLPDLAKLAHNLGIAEVVCETNGQSLDVKELASVDRVRVALNSPDPSISDAITRDPGGHARTMQTLSALSDTGRLVELAVALLPANRGALAELAATPNIAGIVARYVFEGPPEFACLSVKAAADELAAGVRAARHANVPIAIAVGGELPPCVFETPAEMLPVLRIGRTHVERSGDRYRRIPQCERCAAREVCPGPLSPLASRVAREARSLADHEDLSGIVQLPTERSRVLREYRSQFFSDSFSGVVERRIVRLNFHCNQACDFCFVSRELPPVEHELIEREIQEAADRGAVLELSGGEPTLNARLPEYIRAARKLGVRRLDLQTNAIKLADRDYVRELVAAGLDQAFVSLHGITPEVSDRVTAAPGTFVRTIAGIKNLIAEGLLVRLNFVLCGYNVGQLSGFPDFVCDELRGDGGNVIANFSFVAASTDNVPRDTRLIPRFSDVADALEQAHSRASARGLQWSGFDSKCGVPACYLPREIREEHFVHDLPAEELSRAKGFTKSSACEQCELNRRCYGIRSTYAAMYGVDELRPIRDGRVVELPAKSARGSARITNDAAFARLPRTWIDDHPLGTHREVIQLRAGLRSVIKTERANYGAARDAAETAIARGLIARVYADARSSRAIAFIALDERAIEEAMDLEARLMLPVAQRLSAVERMGELLGYPPCCTQRFARSPEQTDTALTAALAGAHVGALAAELNWTAPDIRLFSHFPCSPACPRTADVARRTLRAIEAESEDHAGAVRKALRSLAVVGVDGQFALLEGARSDGAGSWSYDRVLSHRNLGVDDRMLDRTAFRTFYLEVVAPLEQGRQLELVGRSVRLASGAELRYAGRAPYALDFTATRVMRRLEVLRA